MPTMPSRIAKSVAVAAVAVLVAQVATSSAGSGYERSSRTRAEVLFVGDSNAALAAYAIQTELVSLRPDYAYLPTLATRQGSGIRTEDCLAPEACPADYWQGKLAGLEFDALVVNLGINDTLVSGTSTTKGYAGYGHKIDWFMTLAQGRQVIWTNLPCPILAEPRRNGCVRINVHLASAALRWPNLEVVDWNAVAGLHPEWISPDGVHISSNVALTAWTRLVLAELDARYPQL